MVNCIKCPLFALGCNSNIIGKLGDFIKFYGKIPDILVLITGHFGLFKPPTLRLGEAGKTQTQSQTRGLNISKINFKSVRKTIIRAMLHSYVIYICNSSIKETKHLAWDTKRIRQLEGYISYIKHVDSHFYAQLKQYAEKLEHKYCVVVTIFLKHEFF